MRIMLVLLGLTLLLAAGLVVYALTDWAAAAWTALVTAVAIPIVRFLLPLAWFGGEIDDVDIDL